MLRTDDNEILINSLKADDQTSFERIYHLYKHPLYQLALRYLKAPELDGDSLVPLLEDPKADSWKNVAYSYFRNGISLRTSKYRLTRYFREE